MKYTTVTDPCWDEQARIAMNVNFDNLGIVPFLAAPGDVEEHGRELYSRAVAGDFGPIAPYAPSPDPGPRYKTQFSALDFRDRFTLKEQLAIRTAQLTDMEVGLAYDAFISADIDVTDPRVERGIDLYIARGLLEPDRKPALLEPELVPPAA